MGGGLGEQERRRQTRVRIGKLPLPAAQRRRVAAGWLGSAWLVDQHLVWPVRRPVQVPVLHCLQVCWPTRLLADCRRGGGGEGGETVRQCGRRC